MAKYSYPTIIEIAKFAPVRMKVTDTAPWAPGGWRDRPGRDYHTAGMAADFAVARTKTGDKQMREFARWWAKHAGFLLELIHTTPFSDDNGFYVKDGRRVGEGFYGPSINQQHLNHVHVAISVANAHALLGKLKPAAKVAAPVNGSPNGAAKTYVVQGSDTLGALAHRYGTSITKLMKLNPIIKDPDLIVTGWKLRMR
jgi:nucleoid-associated protein YgaU